MLESDEVMLQNQILEIKKQNLQNQQEIEKLEQYGGRLCLRFEGIPIEENEASESLWEFVEIPDTVVDRDTG